MYEGGKRIIGIMVAILVARRLAQREAGQGTLFLGRFSLRELFIRAGPVFHRALSFSEN
jgi:hypothetical protein